MFVSTNAKKCPTVKLVTFNNEKTLCWGKTKAENKRDHGDRNNYFKTVKHFTINLSKLTGKCMN